MSMPKFRVAIKPFWEIDRVTHMDIEATLEGIDIDEGEAVCFINEKTVNIPFCPITKELVVNDDQGEVLTTQNKKSGERSFVETRDWIVHRKTKGDIRYCYRVIPRQLPKDYTSSPYFDFRSEKGGVNGAGLTFLAVPKVEHMVDFELNWDLSQMPKGSQGVWSFGKGQVKKECQPSTIQFSYYAVGLVRSVEEGDFGLYWFSDPPFDVKKVARRTQTLFNYMSKFFKDREGTYRIFVRRDPFEKSGGGTAAARSFMFGYSHATETTVESMQNLLAHEMAHNWPNIPDEPPGYATWYNEGTAEYYSVVLPYRAGVSTVEDILKQIEKRAEKYYFNSMRSLSNKELGKLYWEDRRTQVVPYGRGFFYLANVDAQIKKATGNQKSLDDVVLFILDIARKGTKPTVDNWLEQVKSFIGEQAIIDYENMISGQLIVPDPSAFGGAFKVTQKEIELEDTKKKVEGFVWEINADVKTPIV